MITILHGDNIIKSRQALKQLIDQEKSAGKQTERADAKQLNEASLEELLGSNDLFGTDKLVIIEHLHSLPRSKKKDALVTLITENEQKDIVLIEKRALTPAMLKKFAKAKILEFKSSSSLFKWLDLLGSRNENEKLKLLSEAVESDGDYFCFIMFIRQIRLLIQAKDGGKIAGPPFVVQKINSQARQFSLEKLLAIHEKLYKLDRLQKTSRTPLSLAQELDLLTLSL